MIKLREMWIIHPHFPAYKISNHGKIKNIKRNKLLTHRIALDNGKIRHHFVWLCTAGTKKFKSVHSLVMECFGKPKPNIPNISIDHKDRNPSNNKITNLRWATIREQTKNRTIKSKFKDRKISFKELDEMFIKTKTHTIKQVSEEYKISYYALCHLLLYMHPDY